MFDRGDAGPGPGEEEPDPHRHRAPAAVAVLDTLAAALDDLATVDPAVLAGNDVQLILQREAARLAALRAAVAAAHDDGRAWTTFRRVAHGPRAKPVRSASGELGAWPHGSTARGSTSRAGQRSGAVAAWSHPSGV